MKNTFELDACELSKLGELVSSGFFNNASLEDTEFLKHLHIAAKKLPHRLLEFLTDFKYDPPKQGYCLIRNFPVDDDAIGHTPSHWQLDTNNDTCHDLLLHMCLCSAVLGDIFGWLTQQDGRLVHDVLPIEDHQDEQLGSGSEQELWWHTEDAFHELRGDYLMLFCLRNHDAAPTTVGRPDYSKLTESQKEILFERNFTIKPDDSHKKKNQSEVRSIQTSAENSSYINNAYSVMEARDQAPSEISVLFGSKQDPYIRIDPYFMDAPKSVEAQEALDALIKLTDESIVEIPLKRGDCIIIDNYLAVHGRRSFKARFDGTDRWFKRLNIVRDIRKCNSVLEEPAGRVIF